MIKHFLTLMLIALFMIGAVIFAYFNGGSPSHIKGVKNDDKIVRAAQELKYSVDNYVYSKQKLPATKEELEASKTTSSTSVITTEEKPNIEYKFVSETTYSLCATFATDNKKSALYFDKQFVHPAGYHCFELKSPATPPVQYSPYPVSSAQPATTSATTLTSCKTLDTKMIIEKDGTGTIGCDIEANGEIDLVGSYCRGATSQKYAYLKKDALGRPNRYYATLVGLDPKESIEVVAITPKNGTHIPCKPNLN